MLPRLLVLTDRAQLRLGRGLARTLVECAEAGLTHVVLRELDLPDHHRAVLAGDLARAGLTVIAAHRALPAAAGVHLASGQPAVPAPFGRSCHSREDVARSAGEGAAWVTLSPYGASRSKPGHGPPLDAAAYGDHALPVYALGGITAANAPDAREAGAHGVAVMGEVMRAADPAAVVARLLEAAR